MLRSKHHRRPGLTLMELVVVLVILAALAALLVPRLGFIRDSADAATSAAGSAELANNLEIYKATTGSYPLRMDSLLLTGSSLYDRFSSTGASASAPSWLVMEDLGTTTGPSGQAGGFWYSVVRGGATVVMDHIAYTDGSDPSSSGQTLRDYGAATANGKTAVVNVAATGSAATTVGRIVEASGFTTATIPANVKLVAFGIGPKCGLVGQTMTNVPRHSAQPAEYYGRFIAIFAAYDHGFSAAVKPMQLRCVVDSRGFPVDYRVNQHKLTSPKQE
ncbi:MAG: prepilin-type N-terminal cleavage/methylation domain-containing protein [Planctomycetia bacterium]|nr:prepilin-type N-terminal cleavage/methylation domain-containing protein [Planctomycetia bacterium]